MPSFKIRNTVGCEELSSSFNEYKIEDEISEQQQENKQILNSNNIEQIKVRTEKDRIDHILNLSSQDLDTFKEIVTAYTNADSSLQNLITNLTTQFTALKAVVDSLAPSVP